MKNIHLLSTEKGTGSLAKSPNSSYYIVNNHNRAISDHIDYHIYITNDEKFIRDEYVTDGIEIMKASPKLVDAQGFFSRRDWRKIILTTDPDLIEKGVQSIPNVFLEWFVKNTTCEFVEVVSEVKYFDKNDLCVSLAIYDTDYTKNVYYIIPKHETLEEASQRLYPESEEWNDRMIFEKGAKWQQERYEENCTILETKYELIGGTIFPVTYGPNGLVIIDYPSQPLK